MDWSARTKLLLDLLLPQCHELRQGWALGGSISCGATEALRFEKEPLLVAGRLPQQQGRGRSQPTSAKP
jgi:hypothetical protein